ncbi:glycerol-3-phosphate acyltransferase [Candidatus Babeliales bacterium]|nr:glycerol-3-phosphate acyltransferase [Candidatus Babeliales bacterium]
MNFYIFNFILILVVPYLIGAIPTGYWYCKYFHGIDITKNGSGNIGATNVSRVLGSKKLFFLIFFLDSFKAFLTLFILNYYVSDLLISAICIILGNSYSLFLNFKGGKCVSAALGIFAFFDIKIFLIYVVCWTIILVLSKMVDVASILTFYIITFFVYPIFFFKTFSFFLFLLFLSLWITFRHRSNIKNILTINN